jgi:glycerol-3-phosphate acyltransferase PlsY
MITHFVMGTDIRRQGDGNMGARNTFHTVGRVAGLVVAGADVAKGAIAVTLARSLAVSEWMVFLAGACVVLGHDFPVFLGFQGGQGMAAMVGVFAVLFPKQTVAALCVFAFTLMITHNWDLSCGLGLVSLLGFMWLGGLPASHLLYAVLLIPSIGLKKLLQMWEQGRWRPQNC